MNIFHVRKTGNDAWNGLTEDTAVLTIAAALALCSNDEWNMLIFGPGDWAENVGTTAVPLILVGSYVPFSLSGVPFNTTISGAADANPIVDAQSPFYTLGMRYESNQAGKVFIQANCIDYTVAENNVFVIQANNQIAIDVINGLSIINNNIFTPEGAGAGSYYISHNGELGPPNIYSNIFVWDSVLGLMAEARIAIDSIIAGSQAKYNNNIYADINLVTFALRALYTVRDTYPTGATVKDPEPGQALSWNRINIGVRGVDNRDLTDVFDKIAAVGADIKGADDRDLTQIYDRQTSTELTPKQIWDYASASADVAGSMGKKIVDDFNALLASSAGNNFTIQIYETGGTTPIAGVQGVLRNSAGTAVMEIDTSGADGKLTYTVEDGTYKLYCYKRGSYTFTVPTTITVASGVASPATVYGTPFSPSAPAEPNTCVVYGWLYGVDGAVLADATVEANLENKQAYRTAQKIAKMKNNTTTDANGYWELELVPNPLLTPSGTKYTFSFALNAYQFSDRKTVPDSTTKEYTTLE